MVFHRRASESFPGETPSVRFFSALAQCELCVSVVKFFNNFITSNLDYLSISLYFENNIMKLHLSSDGFMLDI